MARMARRKLPEDISASAVPVLGGTHETLLAGGEEGNEAGKKKLFDSRTIMLHTWTFGEVQPAPGRIAAHGL